MTEIPSVLESNTTDAGRIVENRPPGRVLSTDGVRPSQQPLPHVDAPSELDDVVLLVPQTVLDGGAGCCHRGRDTESHTHQPACGKSGVYESQPLFKVETGLSVSLCADCFPTASPTLTPEGRSNVKSEKHKCWLCGENVPVDDFVAHLAGCESVGESVAIDGL